MVLEILQVDGSINENVIHQYKNNPYSFRDVHFKIKILNIGIKCEKVHPLWFSNPRIDREVLHQLNTIEEAAK